MRSIARHQLRMARAAERAERAERAALIADHIASLTAMYERGHFRIPIDSAGDAFLGPEETRRWIIRNAHS